MSAARVLLIRDAYLRALALDPGNRPARFNLAAWDLRSRPSGTGSAQAALAELAELRAGATRVPASGPVSFLGGRLGDFLTGVRGATADPVWWHSTYMLAAEKANNCQLDDAASLARPAVRTSVRALLRPLVLRSSMGSFAAAAMPPLAVLLAGALGEGIEAPASRRRHPWWRAVRVRWDLARWRTRPPAGTAQRLVDLVYALSGALDAPTRYNLACLYATAHDSADALRQFTLALPALDADLLDWAPHDPALRDVRERVVELVAEEQTRRALVRAALSVRPAPAGPPEDVVESLADAHRQQRSPLAPAA